MLAQMLRVTMGVTLFDKGTDARSFNGQRLATHSNLPSQRTAFFDLPV